MAALHGDPRIMATMHHGPQTAEQALAELRTYVDTWDREGIGIWAIVARRSGTIVGEAGFRIHPDGYGVALRYLLAKPLWGQGLASEAVTAVVGHAFHRAGLARLVAVSREANQASCRLLERAGFSVERRWRDPSGVSLALYVAQNPSGDSKS